MKIQLTQFDEGKHQIEFKKDATELNLNEPFFGLIECSIELTKFSDGATLKIFAKCEGRFCCDRCLKEFEKTVETDFVLKIILENDNINLEENFNIYKIDQLGQVVDISLDIKEYLDLAIPQKLLCNENCFGLCFNCGANLNETEKNICNCSTTEMDPRWDVLKKVL